MLKQLNQCISAIRGISFPSEEYRRDISLDECATPTIKLLVPLIVLKISWEQTLIQNKGSETRKDTQIFLSLQTFLSSCTVAL